MKPDAELAVENNVLKIGIRALGRKEYEKLVKGQRLTLGEQVLAKCYDCCGGYTDGAEDCGCTDCPLYPSHPYNPNRQKRGQDRAQD